ncbi:MAG: transcription antitermination factor NusB, partial [Anaerococcus vaginalis]
MEDFKLILDGLYRISYKNEKSTDIINEIAKKVEDISYITKNIYGVLENKLYLEYILAKLSKIKVKKLDKKVKLILLIGIYNIHFLDRKNYAIVNELVNLTKKVSFKSKSFVNAILRSYIRDEKNLSKINIENDEEFNSIKYSMPLWIIKYLNDSYGKNYTQKFLDSLNKERKISIRINKTKITREKLKNLLEDKGY